MLQGRLSLPQAALELGYRVRRGVEQRRERRMLDGLTSPPAALRTEFAQLTPLQLLSHFRERQKPLFFRGFSHQHETCKLQQSLFPEQGQQLLSIAEDVLKHHWCLLGFGTIDFGKEISWRRDPVSGREWPLDYHADTCLWHNDGSDIRVVWELNRMAHLVWLGRAFVLTSHERFAEEIVNQLDSWCAQNPLGRGPNWSCAMEVALRATNLLTAFLLFRDSALLNERELARLLAVLDQHGAHIKRNLEFSHLGASNHYLTDATGLLWLGILLPELEAASEWRSWALSELLREMDKQILDDGAHYEASTGYHCYVLQMLLYTFILSKENGIEIPHQYWQKLQLMLRYARAILRPEGLSPLIGDSDNGEFLPIRSHKADDHAHLLALGAVIFKDGCLKIPAAPCPEEVLWLLGSEGVGEYEALVANDSTQSQAFSAGGSYVLRSGDLYLLFNASGTGRNGRGSHGHNDALSLEVSACGRTFIVDPGSYVYTADLHQRQLFRSTAYHSTIQVLKVEQNTTNEDSPFRIGDEAHPRILLWQLGLNHDVVTAEHEGYERLSPRLRHRRRVILYKRERCWLVEDDLLGKGEQTISARFHFASNLEVRIFENNVFASDNGTAAKLFIYPMEAKVLPELEPQFNSRQYGAKTPSLSASWTLSVRMPAKLRWLLLPVCAGENAEERLTLVQQQVGNLEQ